MKVGVSKYIIFLAVSSVVFLSLGVDSQAETDVSNISDLYQQANDHLVKGELRQAIFIYEEILEISPDNTKTLLMKGIALSNLEQHKSSMKDFYSVLQKEPDNISAVLGMGVGFGNFGEYKEAQKYFEQASMLSPDNHIVKNYQDFAESTLKKYTYTEVEKPKIIEVNSRENIPNWVKNNAGLWADNEISDNEFLDALEFLIKNEMLIIDLPELDIVSEEAQRVIDRNRWNFDRYLDRIELTVKDNVRYIEYPNPSGDVLKKFMRDYAKWNFDQQIEIGNTSFPDPVYTVIDEVYHLQYNVFVNDQPDGLPLDHVDTLNESFAFWEEMEMVAKDGKPIKVHFERVMKHEANLWVTWVVRDIGENVLGHANLGKGVVEVALGGFNCDGSFQLFHVDTVKTIMTHELGHGIGLTHSSNSESIMYPTIKETKYAYCLLDKIN